MLTIVCVLAAGGVILASARASLSAVPSALAKIGMPLGGGSVRSVSVVGGRNDSLVAVKLAGGEEIVPVHTVAAGATYTVRVVVSRPGWISWLAGRTQTLTKTVRTPVSSLRSRYVTLTRGGALHLRFTQPIRVLAYGPPGRLARHVFASPRSVVTLPHATDAGTTDVAAQVQPWETSKSTAISWFPAGTKATAVASPAPGTQIKPGTPITLTFSKPIAQALGSHLPPVSPTTQGSWHQTSSHALVFRPEGYGYGLAAKVSIALPAGVRLSGGTESGSSSTGTWTVPGGSTTRAQQLLANLGYLPVVFKPAGARVGLTVADQENAAVHAPAGRFVWRYHNTPGQLMSQWQPGDDGVITRGAIMMFETDHDLTADGVLGPVVWKALINAALHDQKSSFGYSFVMVHEADADETSTLWHNGHTIITTPANTGTSAAGGTALGTYPVFEHLVTTTMSGTNPDGSKYSDPGIKWVSYFNGGDALHEYPRGSYGFPQSDGCVEMPMAAAAKIWPYTPVGALVDVSD